MLSPDSVSLVTPPTTTIAKTRDADRKSHLVTAGPDRGGNCESMVGAGESGMVLEGAVRDEGAKADVKKFEECCKGATRLLDLLHGVLAAR